jgi:hypothetical protein
MMVSVVVDKRSTGVISCAIVHPGRDVLMVTNLSTVMSHH